MRTLVFIHLPIIMSLALVYIYNKILYILCIGTIHNVHFIFVHVILVLLLKS